MSHWHVYRITVAGEANLKSGTLDLNLEFYRDCFENTGRAACAMATDIAQRYPDAQRVPSFRDFPTAMAANPNSAFRFTTERGDLVVWYLLECTGRCQDAFQHTELTIRRQLTARFGIPVIS